MLVLNITIIIFSDGPTPVGKLYINRVSQLTRIAGNVAASHVNPTLLDLEGDSDNEDEATGLNTIHKISIITKNCPILCCRLMMILDISILLNFYGYHGYWYFINHFHL